MQDFEENVNDNTPDASGEPENAPESASESVPEIPSENSPEAVYEEAAQEEVIQEETIQEEDPPQPEQPQARSYYAPSDQDFSADSSSYDSKPANTPTVSRENTVLGEVFDKKYDEIVTVQPVRFASFDNDEQITGPPRKNLDIMQDVGVKLTVELGRTKMKVRKLLEITKGSVIEIDKIAGEQAELFVCGKLVARGEVIVIEDKFGLRIAGIVEQKNN